MQEKVRNVESYMQTLVPKNKAKLYSRLQKAKDKIQLMTEIQDARAEARDGRVEDRAHATAEADRVISSLSSIIACKRRLQCPQVSYLSMLRTWVEAALDTSAADTFQAILVDTDSIGSSLQPSPACVPSLD